MRISFIRHGAARLPVGGYRVVFEYARALSARGHQVNVIQAPLCVVGNLNIARRLKNLANFAVRSAGLYGGYRPHAWFDLPRQIHQSWVPSLHPRWIPAAEVVIATTWETAEWVQQFPDTCGRKFHLIQGLETCFEGVDEARVLAVWKAPFHRLVISRWLLDLAHEMGLEADYLPNGLDFNDFGLDIPPQQRNPRQLLMVYHPQACKDFETGWRGILESRESIPDLQVAMFSFFPRPAQVPAWVEYYYRPSRGQLRRLYNQAALFISSSRMEGWGLPSCEAAQCGAALCVTDIGGHREFARHEETALLSPPGDSPALAANIVRLIQHSDLRLRLAKSAHEYVQQFTWAKAVTRLEEILEGDREQKIISKK
jgi:glycosyltransferase involved in cell wall biosynthesis